MLQSHEHNSKKKYNVLGKYGTFLIGRTGMNSDINNAMTLHRCKHYVWVFPTDCKKMDNKAAPQK